jgi:hypothetical protein
MTERDSVVVAEQYEGALGEGGDPSGDFETAAMRVSGEVSDEENAIVVLLRELVHVLVFEEAVDIAHHTEANAAFSGSRQPISSDHERENPLG